MEILLLFSKEAALIDKPDSWATWLTSIAAVLNAIAWPTIAAWFLYFHRTRIAFLLKVIGRKMSSAREFKAGPIEFKTGDEIVMEAVNRARSQISDIQPTKDDSAKQIKDALKDAVNLDEHLEASQLSEEGIRYSVRRRIYGLADEYDRIRSTMPSSRERTRKMNEIAAGMRTLAFESLSIRTELTRSESAGKRLAAICILQIEPRPRYFRWLVQRLTTETQAFLLYQSSIAILEHIKKGFYINPDEARSSISHAISVISAFPGGKPDQNTLDVLNEALSIVR